MKKFNVKGLMIITIFVVSMISMPLMAFGDEGDDNSNQNGMFEGFSGGFGGMFGDNMGEGGGLIGSVFEMLLLQGLDLEASETLEGVFVLSASDEEEYNGSYSFEAKGDTDDYHTLHQIHNGTELLYNYTQQYPGYNNPYCHVEKSGGFNYSLTIGCALTLIIWDHDKSFITAAQKVLDWAQRMAEDEDNEELMAEGVTVLTWLLVHINEIFTGDELFIFNPIVWQRLALDPWANNYSITKTWYDMGPDGIANPEVDYNITKNNATMLTDWGILAEFNHDSYMQWLLDDTPMEADVAETVWTQFSFDIIELWVKQFYIEIDLGAIETGDSDVNPADIFGGCDIEFYLFTHHLAGVFLYQDWNDDKVISANYAPRINGSTGETYKNPDGSEMMFVDSNEVSHQLILGTVEDFDFDEPSIKGEGEDAKVKWGLQLNDLTMRPVPVGIDLNSWKATDDEVLDYAFFGMEFNPKEEEPAEDGTIEASGQVKLDTNFAPWNDGTGPKNEINNTDMAIIYISSIFHFDLDLDTENDSDDTDPDDDDLIDSGDYNNESSEWKIGNYMDENAKDNLDFIDIAGPGYQMGQSESELEASSMYTPTTNIIPLGLWEGQHQSQESHDGDEETDNDDFSTNMDVQAEWNIMIYAVCYPDWNGTGKGIWHDPTFNVYMVFTPETTGFWAIILLIAGVGLIGMATIIIKRRKDNKY